MNRAKIKNTIVTLLENKDLSYILHAVDSFKNKELINPLFGCLCHTNEMIKWHAVSVFGKIVKDIADKDIEEARVIMRRFLWMLNDESGGIGWGVPEAMAEVMFNHDVLAAEYVHMLVSYTLDDGPELYQDGNFIELPLLQQGVLWGLCRIGAKHKALLHEQQIHDNLEPYFLSADAVVRGLVCCLADLLQLAEYKEKAAELVCQQDRFRLYLEGLFYDCSVGEAASNFLREKKEQRNKFLFI